MLELATGRDKDARDEIARGPEYALRLVKEFEELVGFLPTKRRLNELVEVEASRPVPITSLATIAETGEPISNEPAGPWAGPTD